MRLKTYFASGVEAAMLLALEQMGPEAMLVNSRKTTAENRHLGEYEVVFALAPETAPSAAQSASAKDSSHEESEAVRRLHSEVSRLASEIESLGRAMKRSEAKQTVSHFDSEQAEAAQALAEAGFGETFISDSIAASVSGAGSLRFRLLRHLAARLQTAPSLGRNGQGRKVAALVGPAGVGKSTLIAKLAARLGVAARRPCQILSLDSDRVGASEPLRLVAGVLGVGFRLIDEAPMLAPALESLRDRDLVLIDTPGFARDEAAALERLAPVLACREEIDVHLVLAASMKARDLERAIQLYAPLAAAKLILTRLDETEQIGTALEAAMQSGLPVSYLSAGPRVPEDLEPANGVQLARRVFLPAAAAAPPAAAGLSRRAAA